MLSGLRDVDKEVGYRETEPNDSDNPELRWPERGVRVSGDPDPARGTRS